eukprot:9839614-Prorocentrum_lima.AAC.1
MYFKQLVAPVRVAVIADAAYKNNEDKTDLPRIKMIYSCCCWQATYAIATPRWTPLCARLRLKEIVARS